MHDLEEGALVNQRSRAMVLSIWTMIACGVVMLVGSATTLPTWCWIAMAIALPVGVVVWAVAVFRDARANGAGLGRAVWRSIRLSGRALWELVP